MAGSDTYLTIKNFAQGIYKEKGSTFISLAYPVRTVDEIKSILGETKKDHHSARHHCFAYILGQNREIWRSGDDGEPSGTA
ncbi:MAG TPA: YigZ family protein, partial [Bacteroidales bacterium]|nr:YigZ family protein [Bacteroidales bacterium]